MTGITLEPMTRIEGHITVRIELDEAGNVTSVNTTFPELRGFETFLIGRHITRVPFIVPRICGVCPTPHHLASVKAIECGLEIEAPKTAELLRELMLMGGTIHDHALHLLVLAGPDMLLADLPHEKRGLPELLKRYPELVRELMKVRSFGQDLVALLGVQATHPCSATPGGIMKGLTKADKDHLLRELGDIKKIVAKWHDEVVTHFTEFSVKYKDLGAISTNFIALTKEGSLEFYEGVSRILSSNGEVISEFPPMNYLKEVAEQTVEYCYAKRCYLRKLGPVNGIYRVGPLARVNVANRAAGELSNEYLREFKKVFGNPSQTTLSYNIARYICLVHAIERAEELLTDERITGRDTMVPIRVKAGEGVGIVEAPRGHLIHHYKWDERGYVTQAVIITPTAMNFYPIDVSLKDVAIRSIQEGRIDEEKLWHEMGLTIRAYDPCISCATHIIGKRGRFRTFKLNRKKVIQMFF